MGGLGDLPLFNTISALASLGPLPFLFSGVHERGVYGGGSKFSGHYWHSWGGTPSMGSKQGKQVEGFLFKSHAFWDVCGLLVGADLCWF